MQVQNRRGLAKWSGYAVEAVEWDGRESLVNDVVDLNLT